MESKLLAEGYEVFNPASLETEGFTWEMYLARDLKYMCDNLPTMYMLKGWEDSLGARLEMEMAKILGLEIFYE